MNRTIYDPCAYRQELNQSVSPLSFVLDPIKYQHCDKCRPELGILGGTNVSHPMGNLVDLENDLRGANRPATRCPEYKYLPTGKKRVQGKEYIKPVCHPVVDTRMRHLKPCQFMTLPPVPPTPPMDVYSCPPKTGRR